MNYLNLMMTQTIHIYSRPKAFYNKGLWFALYFFIIWALIGNFLPNEGHAFSQERDHVARVDELVINFREAATGIYRSGLIPTEAIPNLKGMGIQTVVSFDNKQTRAKTEMEALRSAGIKAVWTPFSGWEKPQDEQVDLILSLMKDESLRPILIHCKQGQERTGLLFGLWRISEFGWTADEAYEEMVMLGFRDSLWGHLKIYLYEYAVKHGQTSASVSAIERAKVGILSGILSLRKLNPFLKKIPPADLGDIKS